MRFFFVLVCVLFAQFSYSQYYYNDIIVLNQTNSQYQTLKANRIALVNAKSFEGSGEPVDNFVLQQQLLKNWAEVITTSTDPATSSSTVSDADYENGRIKQSVDTGGRVASTVLYNYDASGNINTITSITSDTFMASNSQEVHQWFYNGNSPVRMLRIKDNIDTTVIDFVKDEQGNIAEEHLKKKGRNIETYFYYYNAAHLLTDIVRYNYRAKKMLPDFLFDYDKDGKLTQLTQILQNTGATLTWYYEYNANGLKQTETGYDKDRQVVGKIVYSYN